MTTQSKILAIKRRSIILHLERLFSRVKLHLKNRSVNRIVSVSARIVVTCDRRLASVSLAACYESLFVHSVVKWRGVMSSSIWRYGWLPGTWRSAQRAQPLSAESGMRRWQAVGPGADNSSSKQAYARRDIQPRSALCREAPTLRSATQCALSVALIAECPMLSLLLWPSSSLSRIMRNGGVSWRNGHLAHEIICHV